MAPDLSQLGNIEIPDNSCLLKDKIAQYHNTYLRLREGLYKSVGTMCEWDKSFGQKPTELGNIHCVFAPTDEAIPFVWDIGDSVDYDNKHLLNQPQMKGLAKELSLMLQSIQDAKLKVEPIMSYDNEANVFKATYGMNGTIKPVSSFHAVAVFYKIGVQKFGDDRVKPYDRLIFNYSTDKGESCKFEDEEIVKPLGSEHIQHKSSFIYMLTTALAEFDMSDSGQNISIGYAKLKLMHNVLNHLVDQIEEKGKRVEKDKRLEKLLE